jgi:DNA modification methylase
LQLDVIERSIDLWTNPNDIVLSPFAGIGSEGYCAIKQGRRFVGFELKESYFNWAVRNLQRAEEESQIVDLFSWQAAQADLP